MKKLIYDNYKSIVSRGLITEKTSEIDFLEKLTEETREVFDAVKNKDKDNLAE